MRVKTEEERVGMYFEQSKDFTSSLLLGLIQEKEFLGNRQKLLVYTFSYFDPVQIFENMS